MSDLIDGNEGGGEGKHGQARSLAEAALRARETGQDGEADTLMEQARRADPEAVENLLRELAQSSRPAVQPGADGGTASDEEVAAISRTLQPHSAAPSRAGITGPGSGADAQ